jgi:hypothetical protein
MKPFVCPTMNLIGAGRLPLKVHMSAIGAVLVGALLLMSSADKSEYEHRSQQSLNARLKRRPAFF